MNRKPMKRTGAIKPKRRRSIDTASSLADRSQYRRDNPECELSPFLKRLGQIRAIDENGLGCHHVCIGNFSRIDIVSNLICLSPTIHRWVHSEPTLGLLCCLIVKGLKTPPEINAAEFKRCSGFNLAGWLGLDKTRAACPGWLNPFRLSLIESLKVKE